MMTTKKVKPPSVLSQLKNAKCEIMMLVLQPATFECPLPAKEWTDQSKEMWKNLKWRFDLSSKTEGSFGAIDSQLYHNGAVWRKKNPNGRGYVYVIARGKFPGGDWKQTDGQSLIRKYTAKKNPTKKNPSQTGRVRDEPIPHH